MIGEEGMAESDLGGSTWTGLASDIAKGERRTLGGHLEIRAAKRLARSIYRDAEAQRALDEAAVSAWAEGGMSPTGDTDRDVTKVLGAGIDSVLSPDMKRKTLFNATTDATKENSEGGRGKQTFSSNPRNIYSHPFFLLPTCCRRSANLTSSVIHFFTLRFTLLKERQKVTQRLHQTGIPW